MAACTRCGRKLKTQKSIKLKLGPVCYQKYLKDQEEIGLKENQMTIDDFLDPPERPVISSEWHY